MPFIIKSNKGVRSARLVNQEDSFIESLKGLSLKFEIEVKLVDILEGKVSISSESKQEVNQPEQREPELNNTEEPHAELSQAKVSQPKIVHTEPIAQPEYAKPEEPIKREASKPQFDQPEPITSTRITRSDPVSAPVTRTEMIPPQIARTEFKPPQVSRREFIPPQVTAAYRTPSQPPVEAKMPEPEVVARPEVVEQKPVKTLRFDEDSQPQVSVTKKPIYKVGTRIQACCLYFEAETKPPTCYISRNDDEFVEVSKRITADTDRLNAMPGAKMVEEGQTVLAKSHDDNNWYRAIILDKFANQVDVYFMDWGMKESITLDRLRHITEELSLKSVPACAIKIQIYDTDETLVEDFSGCDTKYEAQVLAFDNVDDSYQIKLLKKLDE